MKIVLQRVARASVSVEDRQVGAIGKGLLLLVGFGPEDHDTPFDDAIRKILNLRIFPGEPEGRSHFDRSVREVGGDILIVSQFTLYADTSRGRRPEFARAAPPAEARQLYERYVDRFRALAEPYKVATGTFGAKMEVDLVNDGPVTLLL